MTHHPGPDDSRPILLVEDNPDDQLLTVEALRLANGAIDYLFGSGRHAGRDASPLPLIVLLDLKLPKVDGLEVLARIRSEERTRDLPVVVLSSSDEPKDLDECRRLGADSYVRKPIGFPEFCEIVRSNWPAWIGRIRSGDSHPRFGA